MARRRDRVTPVLPSSSAAEILKLGAFGWTYRPFRHEVRNWPGSTSSRFRRSAASYPAGRIVNPLTARVVSQFEIPRASQPAMSP